MRVYFPKQYDLKVMHDKARTIISDFSSVVFYKIIYLIQEANFRSYYMNYVPAIHSSKFKRVTSGYKAYLNFLRQENLIERNDYFIVNEQSYLYQFVFQYHETLMHSHIIKDVPIPYTMNNIYNLNHNLYDRDLIDKLKPYLYYLKFDSCEAHKLMASLYMERQSNPNIDYSIWDWIKLENENWQFINVPKPLSPITQYNFEQNIVNRLVDNEYYCHMDSSGWRIHTPLTILPREYKKFVTFRGEELFSVDLKCSQVFLTLVLLNPAFWNTENKNSTDVNISTLGLGHLFKDSGINHKILSAIEKLETDYESFKEHCCNGTIYEYMQETYKTNLGLDLERQDVKIQFYLTLFTANNFLGTKQAKPKRLFRDIFPSIYKVFKAIKTQRSRETLYLNDSDSIPIKKFSALLPIILQRLESYIFIKNVAKKIIKGYPHIPILTIHDSVSTTKEYLPIVEDLVKTELKRITGHSPTLKISSWFDEV